MDLHDPDQRRQVEAALRRVQGVTAARLVPGYERPVDEAHILVNSDRNPKLVVRDLESLLMASFDIATDHRVFSVVQLDEETVIEGSSPRLVLTKTAVVNRGGTVEVEVEIADAGGELVTASVAGGAGQRNRVRTASEATLQATIAATGDAVDAHLQEVEMVEVAGTSLALCIVQFCQPSGTRLISGSAPVRSERIDAVVRATLDAMNRVLALELT